MATPRVFLSHTDHTDLDREATTAILVELRRFGLEVWIDREHAAPEASPVQMDKGPTPDNPLFAHIVDALSQCDAVVYIASPTMFDREYVRLEFDPRVIHQHFQLAHPTIAPEKLPIFYAVVSPLSQPPPFWSDLLDSHPGRVMDLSGAARTPLLLPAALSILVREIAPDYVLPLDPVTAAVVRQVVESDAVHAPGCPLKVPAPIWRRLENYFGLGPLFPGSYSTVGEEQLQYGLNAVASWTKVQRGFKAAITDDMETLLTLWSANMMLRSRTFRIQDGDDIPLKFSFQNLLRRAKPELNALTAAIYLQFGYTLASSRVAPDKDGAVRFLSAARDYFTQIGAVPLMAHAAVLIARVQGEGLSEVESSAGMAAAEVVRDSGVPLETDDLRTLHHALLDAAFPGPRAEATPEYRAAARSIREHTVQAASELKAGFARIGEEKWNPEFWERKG